MLMLDPFLFLVAHVFGEAKGAPLCIRKTSQGYEEPASLTALLRCQERERDAFIEAYRAAHDGNDPPEETLSSIATRQMKQAGEYVKRRPKDADAKGVAELSEVLQRQVEARMSDKDKDEARELRGLQESLARKADAKRELTPGMAAEAREYVRKKQGGVSADLERSLDALGSYSKEPGEEAWKQLKPGAHPPDNSDADAGRDAALRSLEERIMGTPRQESEPAKSE